MAERPRFLRRASTWVQGGILATVFGLAVAGPGTFLAVEHSSQPEFCTTCHLMDPYYESWERSAHHGIKCIECHFEPGTMGTLVGKFQALNQLTKYVTQSAGTRPWAHVTDTSCLQSGCHSMTGLEGRIDFDGVAFDHTPHLLETRGKRLRCVTCHTQMTVENHFQVETSICWTCHFQPDDTGVVPERTGNCTVCHDPPDHPIDVAGQAFSHADYIARGVDCRDCHASVVQGTGTVHEQRCRSCHGEPELIAQFDQPALLHREHVTDHKVECMECHLDIRHGSPEALGMDAHAGGQDCAQCHGDRGVDGLLLAEGRGFSVEGEASRMHETHVACTACHSGRSAAGGDDLVDVKTVHAPVGEVDCVHCHGTGFAGMLTEWRTTLGGALDGMLPAAEELARSGAAASDADRLDAALGDLRLLARDGSHGVHNPGLALEVLRSAAATIDGAWTAAGDERAGQAAALLPPPVDAACATCHMNVTVRDPLTVDGRDFSHERHLVTVGLSCGECHVLEPNGMPGHGQPAFPRDTCGQCHHEERDDLDPSDCAQCHSQQEAVFTGTLADVADAPVTMADKTCNECHGEAPEILVPAPAMCVLCHEEGYDEKLSTWRNETDARVAKLAAALASPPAGADAAAVETAERTLALVRADGSRGVHNFDLIQRLLNEALEGLGAQ